MLSELIEQTHEKRHAKAGNSDPLFWGVIAVRSMILLEFCRGDMQFDNRVVSFFFGGCEAASV